ncbi:MAG: hypothetical protein ACRYFZ_06200 [Janthinobacterium lividum]
MSSENEKELLNALLPLWLAFPAIPRYSIGWRMGEGDSYSWEFSKWWKKLSPAAQQEYQKLYPEPIGWRGWYAEAEWEEEEGDEGEKTEGYELDGV